MTKKNFFITAAVCALAILITSCGAGGDSGDGDGAVAETSAPIQLKSRQIGGFFYDLNAAGDGIVITNYAGRGGVIEIPSIIENIPVVEIGENAFRGRSREKDSPRPGDDIISVIVPNGVRIIGRGAFSDCRNLNSVILPDSVEEIREVAFRGCSNLLSINLPARIRFIGLNAFFRNGSLVDMSIPEGIGAIEWQGWNHFSGCSKLPQETRDRLKSLGYPAAF